MARGGQREGAGRPKGAANKATHQQKDSLASQARSHAAKALKALADIAENGSAESARVTAAIAILDRAYGRPRPMPDEPVGNPLKDLVDGIMRNAQSMPIATQVARQQKEATTPEMNKSEPATQQKEATTPEMNKSEPATLR